MPSLFKRIFLQNFGLKVMSLLLAIGLWLAVARSPVVEVVMKVPIEFKRVPENLEIDSASFTEAQIRVRGPERLVNRLRSTDVGAYVDLSAVAPGTRTFDLTSNVTVPHGLEVVQVDPTQFQLSFDNRMTRTVEVHPRVTGNFAPGMRVAQAIADPSNVMITGPRRRVERVEAATTDPVDASGTMERGAFVTEAYVPEPLIHVVHPTPIRVTVIMERSGEENSGEEKKMQ
jgi:YbbR domain-containing protein